MTFTVYKITAPHSDKVYFGVTRQIPVCRMEYHINALERGYHTNNELQAAYDANPEGWQMTVIATYYVRADAEQHETNLIEVNARHAFNVQKNPLKFSQCSKVSAAVAAEILALRDEEYSYVVAKQFGVAQSTVSAIWRGVHWSSCNAPHATIHDLAVMAKAFMSKVNLQSAPVLATI